MTFEFIATEEVTIKISRFFTKAPNFLRFLAKISRFDRIYKMNHFTTPRSTLAKAV